jgi:geranylgeranyl diphosphate synthase type II
MEYYREEINNLLDTHLNLFFKTSIKNSTIKQIIQYTLKNGQRIRPAISLDIYNSLCKKYNLPNHYKIVFLAVEYIHCSSLIIDDLPCMDNAILRRGDLCIHKKYGEAITQLSSVILLSLASNSIITDLKNDYSKELYIYIFDHFSTLLSDLANGQYLDLSYSNDDIGMLLKDVSNEFTSEDIIMKKTGILFQTSFIYGWILGNGNIKQLDKIKDLSFNFSMAFQILDDIEDMDEDLQTNKKNVNQNYALKYGKKIAIEKVFEYLTNTSIYLKELELYSDFFDDLIQHMFNKLDKFTSI